MIEHYTSINTFIDNFLLKLLVARSETGALMHISEPAQPDAALHTRRATPAPAPARALCFCMSLH